MFAVVVVVVSAEDPECVGASCHASQGLQYVGKFVRSYLESQPQDMQLTDGVHLVDVGGNEGDARAANDNSILTSIVSFLRRHELKIKLPELMPDQDTMSRTFKQVMDDFNGNDIGGNITRKLTYSSELMHYFYVSEARKGGYKGGKKGNSGLLLMALMMGKTLAAIGFGTVGLLAMKALMVSALALMLSLIVGLKKLLSSGHEEHGHTVIHATAGGHDHRRKREATDMAYHAWNEYLTR